MSDREKDLGDFLADRMSVGKQQPQATPTSPRGEDRFIVALAAAWGEDPVAVLKEFHANTALARLARKLLGVNFREALTSAEQVYLLREQVRDDLKLKGQELDAAVADILNGERDAAGLPVNNVSVDSIRPLAGRGGKAFHARGLATLFDLSGR